MTTSNKIYAAALVLLCAFIGLELKARADYNVTEGSGTVIFAFTCFTSKVCPAHVNVDNAGTEIFTASNPGYARVASGHIASGAIASGAIASGAVASGAFSSGSIASGALAAGSMVDFLTIRGTKAAGTAAANSALTGGVYNSGGVTLTDGQQAATQFHSDGSTLVRVTGSVGVAQGSTTSGQTQSLVGCAVTTGEPSYTTAQTSPCSLETTGKVRVSGTGATGAAPPATAQYNGGLGSGATGGLLAGLKTCDLHAKYDASDNGSKTLVTGVSGRKVYICGYIMATGGTATNLKLREGSDADCASNGADLTPAYQLVANDRIGMQAPFWTGLVTSTNAYYVCINASAGNAHQAQIWYTIQ